MAVAGPLRLLEPPSAAAGPLGRRRRRAAAEGCGDRSVVTHRCQGKQTRCIRPASSRRGTGRPPGPPGSAPRGLPVPLASRRPSRGTPRSPSATRPLTRRRPRPGRSLTTACCRTGGRRDAPIATGAHTPATPARCSGRRPMAGRRDPAGLPRAPDDRPPHLDGMARPAAKPERTAGAPARRSPRGRDAGSEGSHRQGLHPRARHSWGLGNRGPDRRTPDRWGPDRRSRHNWGPHRESPRRRSRSCRGLPIASDPRWARGRRPRAPAKTKSSGAPAPPLAPVPHLRAAGRANQAGQAAEPSPACGTRS